LDHDQQRAGDGGGRDRDGKGDALDTDRRGRHQLQRKLVLRHGHDGAAGEGPGQEQLERRHQRKRNEARHQHAQRQVDHADIDARPDIGRLHVAIVDAEHEHQRDLGDEHQPEEEGEAAQRILSAPLKRFVIDLIDHGAERIERRQQHHARQDRVDAEPGIDDIGDVGTEDDEPRMRDVDDVEDSERDRDADERAQQETRDQRVDQQVVWNVHGPPAKSYWRGAMRESDKSALFADPSSPAQAGDPVNTGI
jgi:hypothetical protein